MTPAAYRYALARLDLSGRAFGRVCGVNERTAERWSTGGPPPPVEALLSALEAMPAKQRKNWVDARLGASNGRR